MIDENRGKTCIDYYLSSKYQPRWGYMRIKYKRKLLYISKLSKIFENDVRSIPLFIEDETYLDMDLLYDLIQAGLIEKV